MRILIIQIILIKRQHPVERALHSYKPKLPTLRNYETEIKQTISQKPGQNTKISGLAVKHFLYDKRYNKMLHCKVNWGGQAIEGRYEGLCRQSMSRYM